MPASIHQVAARARVSVGTVSKVLNGQAIGQIAAATQTRVREAALELGYAPSAVARALVRRQSETIGVLFTLGQSSPLKIAYFAAVFDALLEAAAARGRNVMVVTGHRWENRVRSLPAFRSAHCDGYIVFIQPAETDLFAAFIEENIPFVLVSDTRDEAEITCVDVDNFAAGRAVAAHLLGLGHERFAILSPMASGRYAHDRIAGFRAGLTEAGIRNDVPAIAPEPLNWDGILAALQSLWGAPLEARPTALFCVTDFLAHFALRIFSCWETGPVRVPEEISVVGFDDIPASSEGPLGLTTIRQPFAELAQTALDFLLQQIEDGDKRGSKAFLSAPLIVRGTTAPPRSVQ